MRARGLSNSLSMIVVGYMRTSSAANVGEDKNSETRQRAAIQAHASTGKFMIGEFYYDAAVSGKDYLENRAGFAKMIKDCRERNINTIIVESISRFARSLLVQEIGLKCLDGLGTRVLCADAPRLLCDESSSGTLMRGFMGAVAEYQRKYTTDVLKKGRDALDYCDSRKILYWVSGAGGRAGGGGKGSALFFSALFYLFT